MRLAWLLKQSNRGDSHAMREHYYKENMIRLQTRLFSVPEDGQGLRKQQDEEDRRLRNLASPFFRVRAATVIQRASKGLAWTLSYLRASVSVILSKLRYLIVTRSRGFGDASSTTFTLPRYE
jgi:hypothetical protein